MSKEDIKSKETEELVDWWKGLVWVNYLYGSISLSELHTIKLLERELQSRNYPGRKLNSWYAQAKKDFKNVKF